MVSRELLCLLNSIDWEHSITLYLKTLVEFSDSFKYLDRLPRAHFAPQKGNVPARLFP